MLMPLFSHFIGNTLTLRKTQPAKNVSFFSHARTEKSTVEEVFWRAEGAVLEAAFFAGCAFRRVGAVLT